jgi:hypothetical protein
MKPLSLHLSSFSPRSPSGTRNSPEALVASIDEDVFAYNGIGDRDQM